MYIYIYIMDIFHDHPRFLVIKRSDTSSSIESTKNESFHTHTHTKLKKKLWIPSSTKWFTVMNLCQKKSPKNEFSTHCSHTFWILDALKHSKKTNVFFATDPRVFHTWWLSQQSICHQGTPRVHPVDLEHLRGDTVAKVDGATATPK